jgi:GxxExxY protein
MTEESRGVMSFARGGALSERVIGLAIEVHRHSGPGLLESTYEECLCFELQRAAIRFAQQVPLPVVYKEIELEHGYRIDIVVEDELVLEI